MDVEQFRALIAQNIKDRATKAGISLNSVADTAGVARSHLFAVVWGQKALTTDTLLKIARVLEVQPWQLLKPRSKPTQA